MRFLHFAATLLLVLLLAGPALAGKGGITTDSIEGSWNQLTEQQKAQLATQIAKEASKNDTLFNGQVVTKNVKVDEVEPWLSLIDKVGEGLVRLAKDLGVTANELLVTPVGVVTVGLVAYHVMGDDVIDAFSAFAFALVAFPLLTLFFFKSVIPVIEWKEFVVDGWRGKRVVIRRIRRTPIFGASEDFNQDWLFAIVAAASFLIFVILLP